MSVRVRRRPYIIKVREVESGATTDRQTLLTPAKADNIITEPSKGIDILAVPDEGSASTGPAWPARPSAPGGGGRAPENPHKILIQYTEES